jgi:cytoskeletal protein RodZ
LSSILKALKKIEGRKVETRLPVWRKQFGSQEIMDSQIRKSRQRQKILGALIILCVAAIGIELYSGWRSESSTPENSLASNAGIPVPGEKTPAATETGKPASPDTAIATDTTESSPVASTVTAPAEIKAAPEVSPESHPPEETTETPVEISPEPVPPAKAEEKTPAPAVAATDAPAPEVFIQAPANNAGLALHALVWSKNPDERFVVINGAILREGATIEGYTIVRIEKKYAVMKSGKGLWKLK